MARASVFLLPAAFLLVSPAIFSQAPTAPAPPEVDKALRAHVTEFFQDFVDGKYRQALKLVADDTQDDYFASSKMEIKSFEIEGIDYAPDFTQAAVKVKVKRVWKMKAEGFLQDILVDNSMDTAWKIEDGSWVWTQKVPAGTWATPMGGLASKVDPADPASKLPKKIDQDSAAAEAARILSDAGTGLNPMDVTLGPDYPASSKVVFHNGKTGAVGLSVGELPPNLPGLTVHTDKSQVNAGEDATVEIEFNPPADYKIFEQSLQIDVNVMPFNQTFPITIKLTTAH